MGSTESWVSGPPEQEIERDGLGGADDARDQDISDMMEIIEQGINPNDGGRSQNAIIDAIAKEACRQYDGSMDCIREGGESRLCALIVESCYRLGFSRSDIGSGMRIPLNNVTRAKAWLWSSEGGELVAIRRKNVLTETDTFMRRIKDAYNQANRSWVEAFEAGVADSDKRAAPVGFAE